MFPGHIPHSSQCHCNRTLKCHCISDCLGNTLVVHITGKCESDVDFFEYSWRCFPARTLNLYSERIRLDSFFQKSLDHSGPCATTESCYQIFYRVRVLATYSNCEVRIDLCKKISTPSCDTFMIKFIGFSNLSSSISMPHSIILCSQEISAAFPSITATGHVRVIVS